MVLQDHAVEFDLARDAQSVRRARRLVAGWVDDGDRAAILDTALLLVSELVGNAVRYGEEPITLDARWDGDALVIGVADACAQLPRLPPPPPEIQVIHDGSQTLTNHESIGGRGLRLISTLADGWGIEKRSRGKRVWFVLRAAAQR